MKNLPITAFVFATCLSTSAFANTFVQCGKHADVNSSEVTNFELAISSEGADEYSGPVGRKWNLKIGSDSSEWLEPNQNITAKNYISGDNTVVEITIKTGQSVTGGVGTKYKLTGLYDDAPKLEKFTYGGFAGTVRVGTYECISGND